MRNFPAVRIGVVDSDLDGEVQRIEMGGVYGETLSLTLAELSEKHYGTLPAVLGPTVA
jgi:hypothetical protein